MVIQIAEIVLPVQRKRRGKRENFGRMPGERQGPKAAKKPNLIREVGI